MQHLQIVSYLLKSRTHMDLRSRVQSLEFASERTDLSTEEQAELQRLQQEFAEEGAALEELWQELWTRHRELVTDFAHAQKNRLEKQLQSDDQAKKNWEDSWRTQLAHWQLLIQGKPEVSPWWLFGLVPEESTH